MTRAGKHIFQKRKKNLATRCFKARTEDAGNSKIIGKYEQNLKNDIGQRLIDLCTRYNDIVNT